MTLIKWFVELKFAINHLTSVDECDFVYVILASDAS